MTEKLNRTLLLSALDNYGGHPFDTIFDEVMAVYGPNEVEVAARFVEKPVLIIWGGQDISPTIYNQKPNKHTDASERIGERDRLEIALALKCMEMGIPIIGICRGAQLMCALSGGSLVQHVTRHAGPSHAIITNEGEKYKCPSVHHQMMHPWPLEEGKDFEKLAWMETPISEYYLGEPDDNGKEKQLVIPYEPEVLYFYGTKSLCIQSHPEYIQQVTHPFVEYSLKLTKKYCL